MHIATGNARRGQAQAGLAGLHEQIHHLIAGQMPAFEQHGLRAHGQQLVGCRWQIRGVFQGAAQQPGGFVQIGGDQVGARKHLAHQHRHRFLGNQAVAAGGHHHRVEHHMGGLVMRDGPGHHLGHLGGVQHANFDGVGADVVEHRLNLRLQKRRWHGMDVLHAQRVLRGQGRDRAHPVAAQRGKGFQVGLDAGAAAAVGPGNGQNTGVLVGGWCGFHARHYQESAVAA